MTDDEIVKALECCNTNGGCIYCPLFEIMGMRCITQLNVHAFALIRRQQEEIEELKELVNELDEIICEEDTQDL